MAIRAATSDDYEAIAAMSNLVDVNKMFTAAYLHDADAKRPPHCQHQAFLAIEQGEVIGYAHYTQYADMYTLRKFWVTIRVHPDYRWQGVATRLHQTLLENVQPFQPIAFQTSFKENNFAATAFATKFGYMEFSRRVGYCIDINEFDVSRFMSYLPRVESNGIRLKPVAELVSEPNFAERLHTMQYRVEADVPMADPVTPLTLDEWRKQFIESQAFVADGSFVACDGDRYVGLSFFFQHGTGALYTDITGVLPEYRRRGIATALKVRGLQFAKENGFTSVHVTNDAVNDGMRAVNKLLGYDEEPALLQLRLLLPLVADG